MFFSISKEQIKKEVQDNLDYLSSMSVEEYTLYRKWVDINMQKWTDKDKIFISQVKSQIWKPNNINDYLNIVPKVIFVESKKDQLIWNVLRTFTHTGTWKRSPGRLLKFYIIDSITKQYLGILSFGSDFIGIGGRDDVIGWSLDHKLKNGMLKHTMMASTISPTQPLGYNYLGGKLIALLSASDIIEKSFNKKYPEKLVGITTTSLYGGYSQYTRLQNWKKCKSSDGTITLEPSEDVYNKIKIWLKDNYSKEYSEMSTKSHPKNRILQFVYKELNIKTYQNNAPRGVYWCPLYENTNSFLKMETTEVGNKKFDNSVNALSNLWKEKYASKRVSQNKNIVDALFYDDMLQLDWKNIKEKYLKDVGR